LLIAVGSVGLALVLGVTLGLVTGYYGGVVDRLGMWITDILLSFPYLLLAIVIVAILKPGVTAVIIALGVRTFPRCVRLVRSSVLSNKSREYVLAAKSIGASDLRILTRHILPNLVSPIIIYGTSYLGRNILSTAYLSFLGFGPPPPTPTWGTMASVGQTYLRTAPHMVLFPALMIFLTVLGFNLLGDGLRDILDPRERGYI
jgi:peptide/nickel transport system permease protein